MKLLGRYTIPPQDMGFSDFFLLEVVGRGGEGFFFRSFSYDTLAEYCINYLGTKYK